jgi:hypothetical protein
MLRSSVGGLLATFAVVVIQVLCYVAYRADLISALLAVVALLLISLIAVWLFPYFMRVHLVARTET